MNNLIPVEFKPSKWDIPVYIILILIGLWMLITVNQLFDLCPLKECWVE